MTEITELIRADLQRVQDRREQMRQAMPGVASLVDEARAAFGDVKVRWAREGDKEVGTRQPFDGTDVDKILRYHDLAAHRAKRSKRP